MLYGNWLVLPVLFPIFGGLMAAASIPSGRDVPSFPPS